MAMNADMKEIVKHLVNGSFNKSLCRICLLPLNEINEDMFTKICKNEKEYCIADVLNCLCDIQVSVSDNYKICPDCFIAGSSAYKFYLMSKRSQEILEYYVSLLEGHLSLLNTSDNSLADSICLTLPLLIPETQTYDYDISGLFLDSHITNYDNCDNKNSIEVIAENKIKNELSHLNFSDDDNNILIIADENGATFYESHEDAFIAASDTNSGDLNSLPSGTKAKRKRKRNPMSYIMCSKCPVRYRFVAKLKEHMKSEHDIDLFVCSVCKMIIENEDEFNKHLKTHSNIHRCAKCNVVFKKRESIIAHLKWHEEMENLEQTEGAHICEVCGLVLKDAEHLKDHIEKKHAKKYTCYYCGRMYKGEISFEMHIQKHEMHIKGDKKKHLDKPNGKDAGRGKRSKKFICGTCGRNFVDDRSLMWHQRLHTNERPYVCDVCGRGFVSLNRRNQHAICAHTAPARMCPLCPALFHLRSMVNTHVRKVHLKAHKRRNRATKYQDVFWRTEPVPIQELSVSIQNDILELQAAQKEATGSSEWN